MFAKSTTHEERYYHLKPGQVADVGGRDGKYQGASFFFRKEWDGMWYGALALCSKTDVFQKRIGRTVARRRYFRNRKQLGPVLVPSGPDTVVVGLEPPSYDLCLSLYTSRVGA